MKKSPSSEQNSLRQARSGGRRGKASPAAATPKGVKLPPSRVNAPAGLLPEHASNHEAHVVSFEYFNPKAREVLVAGSFNDWQPGATPMTKQRDGRWSTELLLEPGQHEYRFVVDGQWQDDPVAARFMSNPFGGLNCVVEVKPIAAAMLAPSSGVKSGPGSRRPAPRNR